MAALHSALESLSPTPWSSVPTTDLKSFLEEAFTNAQILVDSVPIPDASKPVAEAAVGRSRAASNASEMSESGARSSSPAPRIEELKGSWGKPVKVGAKENPLGISVFKMAGNDRKGAWFARRSVHEGLGFSKWKSALEAEFPETMKVQGAPGEGNVRGIGGERRVEYQDVEGLGRVEVFHLSAQFPGPTTPRDFVTLLLTSEQALDKDAGGTEDGKIPRHFMIISRPCEHPDCPERSGFIRGQYQSVEFIREIPRKKGPSGAKAASTSDLSDTRSRGNSDLKREVVMRNAHKHGKSETDVSNVEATEEDEGNPVEWIMVTRSDPGGSVPRFMIERGTPGGICGDAKSFLDWACAIDEQSLVTEVPEAADESGDGTAASDTGIHPTKAKATAVNKQMHDYQTNGHLSGIQPDGHHVSAPVPEEPQAYGLFSYVAGAAGVAGATIAAYTPEVIKSHILGHSTETSAATSTPMATRRDSTSSESSDASTDSFTSATEGTGSIIYASNSLVHHSADTSSIHTETSSTLRRLDAVQEKELQRLEDKRRKLDERLVKDKEKESGETSAAISKAQAKHDKDVRKQEEKYQKEVAKLEKKKEKEERKRASKQRKEAENDDKIRLMNEIETLKQQLEIARMDRDMFKGQVGELQRENTTLVQKSTGAGAGIASRPQSGMSQGQVVPVAEWRESLDR